MKPRKPATTTLVQSQKSVEQSIIIPTLPNACAGVGEMSNGGPVTPQQSVEQCIVRAYLNILCANPPQPQQSVEQSIFIPYLPYLGRAPVLGRHPTKNPWLCNVS